MEIIRLEIYGTYEPFFLEGTGQVVHRKSLRELADNVVQATVGDQRRTDVRSVEEAEHFGREVRKKHERCTKAYTDVRIRETGAGPDQDRTLQEFPIFWALERSVLTHALKIVDECPEGFVKRTVLSAVLFTKHVPNKHLIMVFK